MNVAQLIARLQSNYELTDLVMIATDEEGNTFNLVDDLSAEFVEMDYDGGETDALFSEDDFSDQEGFTVKEFEKNFKRVVVFWP